MSRISEAFDRLKRAGRRGLIPFITAGDPDLDTTRALILELARAGAACVELGVPFSDPVADGPVIQRSSQRALQNGVGVAEVIETIAQVRRDCDVPLVLFSYFNPLLQFGLDRVAADGQRAGVDGVLVTDLVPEESSELGDQLSRHALDHILLAAPTTSDERLRAIADRATGFIYAVSRTGVTGTRTELDAEAENLTKRLRKCSEKPIAVGFGISTREHVTEVWKYADAAVVGSAIVAEIEKQLEASDLAVRIGSFVRSLLPEERGGS